MKRPEWLPENISLQRDRPDSVVGDPLVWISVSGRSKSWYLEVDFHQRKKTFDPTAWHYACEIAALCGGKLSEGCKTSSVIREFRFKNREMTCVAATRIWLFAGELQKLGIGLQERGQACPIYQASRKYPYLEVVTSAFPKDFYPNR